MNEIRNEPMGWEEPVAGPRGEPGVNACARLPWAGKATGVFALDLPVEQLGQWVHGK